MAIPIEINLEASPNSSRFDLWELGVVLNSFFTENRDAIRGRNPSDRLVRVLNSFHRAMELYGGEINQDVLRDLYIVDNREGKVFLVQTINLNTRDTNGSTPCFS